MPSVGLDVGTGFVKCVSDTSRIKFPSLYACRQSVAWEDSKWRVTAVGYDAVKMSENPDAVVIRPVMQGSPVNEYAFAKLVSKALELALQNGAMADAGNLDIAVGLPYEARAHRNSIKRLVLKLATPHTCHVVPQVIGTLVEVGLSDAIIVSIGQGTTEIVAFQDHRPIKGVSSHHAVNDISSRLGAGKMSYLDEELYEDFKAGSLVGLLVDSIIDDLNEIRQDLGSLPLVFSGGGMMIPRLREKIRSKISPDVVIPRDPVMSNAQGLYKLASETC